jgi:hypothetical protein
MAAIDFVALGGASKNVNKLIYKLFFDEEWMRISAQSRLTKQI